MITFKQLHEKTLPEHKKKAVKRDVISYYLWRPICDLCSIFLININVTPTQVTIASFYACIASLLIFIFIPGKIGAISGWILLWAWNIMDGIDGNIARYKNQCSKMGDFWDAVAGYFAMITLYFAMGVVAYNETSIIPIDILNKYYYLIMGSLAAIFMIFPRLATQKKNVVFGDKAVENLKNKADYGLLKTLMLNINSINGFASLMFLVAIIYNFTNLFTIIYFIINMVFFTLGMILAMRDPER